MTHKFAENRSKIKVEDGNPVTTVKHTKWVYGFTKEPLVVGD